MTLNAWSPARRDGWWPQISVTAEGRIFVAYGNVECSLAEVRLVEGRLVTVSDVLVGPGLRNPRWLHPNVLTAWRDRGDVGRDVTERWELDVRDTPPTFRVVEGPALRVGGNVMDARDGHVATWLAPPYGTARVDDVDLGASGGAVSTAEGWVCGATIDHKAVMRRAPGGRVEYFPMLAPLHQAACGPAGFVAYGGYGAIAGLQPDGEQLDLTVTPWRWEGVGPLWRGTDGQIWLASTTWRDDSGGLILLRPWGEQGCVQIPRGAVSVTVAEHDGQWVVASCDDVGRAVVDAVPITAARQMVALPVPDPAPEPSPIPVPDPNPKPKPPPDQEPSVPSLKLPTSDWINPGESVAAEVNMQRTGNLVCTLGGVFLWHSGTHGMPGARAMMTGDNRIMVEYQGRPVWYYGAGLVEHTEPGPRPDPAPHPDPVEQHGPISRPEPIIRGVGASDYQALGDPRVNLEGLAAAIGSLGCRHTRVWLIDAWAAGTGETGTYAGFLPILRPVEGPWNLYEWNTAYFIRLRAFADSMNCHGIVPLFTLLELYSWSERKQGLLWVPNQNAGPWRNNINGIRWGNPDDVTFGVDDNPLGLPDDWMTEFARRVLAALDGTSFCLELGNEMPEKPMHYRLRDMLRSLGYSGRIYINRQEDTPGQMANMRVGQDFDGISFHGKAELGYLDEDFDREPVHRTFRSFFDSRPDFSRITLSSDGCRNRADSVPDTYDYSSLLPVAQDLLRRGGSYEHQLCIKMRRFLHGGFDLNDITFDAPFLRALTGA